MEQNQKFSKIDKVLTSGLKILSSRQQKDGSFLSFSSPTQNNFSGAKKYNSVFPASLILSCLSKIENPEAEKIKKKAAKFLLSQKSDFYSFNYWKRGSGESKKLPYPDDLDDTFCALMALYLLDKNLLDGEALAKIVALLTSVEEKEGGPYRTWLVNNSADNVWKDIDLAVNSNVAYFLSLLEVDLPNLEKMAEEAICNKKFISPYYPSIYPIIYFISRFYRGKKKGELLKFILSKQKNGRWENPLYTALAVSSLLNLGIEEELEIKQAIEYLVQFQKSGAWKPYAFCIDPAINRKTYYAGSAELTTAFCMEAINKYDKMINIDNICSKISNKDIFCRDVAMQRLYRRIILAMRKNF